jgi:hypothetical protein
VIREWFRVGVVKDRVSCDAIKFAKSGLPLPLRKPENLGRSRDKVEHSWTLQLIGDSSESRAMAEYRRLQIKFYEVLANRPPVV